MDGIRRALLHVEVVVAKPIDVCGQIRLNAAIASAFRFRATSISALYMMRSFMAPSKTPSRLASSRPDASLAEAR
jgi:hypothetical protein